MQNISMNQALDIWSELWQAYYGKNGFGSDTAEIYAYRLMAYNPTYHSGLNFNSAFRDTERFKKAQEEVCEQAQNSLVALLKKFAAENDCMIEVNGKTVDDWAGSEMFDHRCHVKIMTK
jgi:hypothetical protein